jgi:tRNA dimethylallyltransferase
MPGRDPDLRARIRGVAGRPRGNVWLHRWLSKIDPQSGRRIAPADRHRVERALEVWLITGRPISEWVRPAGGTTDEMAVTKIGLTMDRRRLVERLDQRVDAMYAAGLVGETRGLLARFPRAARPFGAIGYAEAAAVVSGEMNIDAAIAETKRRTRSYAKRQMTWLRSERNVQWIEVADEVRGDVVNNDEMLAVAMPLINSPIEEQK